MSGSIIFWKIINWIFGIVVLLDGVLNLIRGNDFGFGIFLILLSFVYLPPTKTIIEKKINFSVHYLIRVLLAVFIIWATLAVGALAEGYYSNIF